MGHRLPITGVLAILTCAALAFGLPSTGTIQPASFVLNVPTTRLLGQRIMVGLPGTRADAGLLHRVRAGEVGAVILFAYNITDTGQVRRLTASLQRAAQQGGNPPLLIAIDQEGGQIRRFPTGPPYLSPPQMAATGDPSTAMRQGQLTGAFLKARGINMDFAPVADVPASARAFIWRQGRAFSFRADEVARYAAAFALGLQSAGVAATAKHFPGLGTALTDTDLALDELHPSSAQLSAALVPYQTLISDGLDAVMLTTAGYTAYDPTGAPAAFSARIGQGLLRDQLHFQGMTITDALGVPTGHSEVDAGVLAARAGADLLLYTDSARGELGALMAALHSGRFDRGRALASYLRIIALKNSVGRS